MTDSEVLPRGDWFDVTSVSSSAARPSAPPKNSWWFAWLAVVAIAVIVAVLIGGIVAARQLAETEAINGAATRAELIADALVQPDLSDGLLTGDPAAIAALDEVARNHILNTTVVRVKIWAQDGRVLYSDEPRLIGQTFALGDDEEDALSSGVVHAEVSNLTAPENRYERDFGTLLEAYRPVTSPSGQHMLFEAYFPYDEVEQRTQELWGGFASITVGSIVLLVVLLIPVLWRLVALLRHSREERLRFLQQAVDASASERRRIAATLHDGVVQDLAGTSFALAGSLQRASRLGDGALTSDLDSVARTVRGSIGGLRSLLVDIYPPSLRDAGLAAALNDLASGLRSRGIAVQVSVAPGAEHIPHVERLLFRVAQETLTNIAKHSAAGSVRITLAKIDSRVQLDIDDDGVGFDAPAALAAPAEGHFGLRLVADLVRDAGGHLSVKTHPGRGTAWRLRVSES